MDIVSAEPIVDGALLRAFAAFAEERNFTRAARRLGLSQPALFERVARLASLLEVPLYRREGRSLVLTEQGVRLAAHARESHERALALVRELRGLTVADTVTLAAGEGSYLFLVGPALTRFTTEGGRLRPLTLGARDACAAVLSGVAHLGVCAMDLLPAGLTSVELLRTPLCLAMPATHPLAARRKIAISALAGERLILSPSGQLHREFVGRALSRLAPEQLGPDPIEADGWPLMLRFVQLGLGVAVVNGICTLPNGTVSRPVPEMGTITYRLVRRQEARLSASGERLAALLSELGAR